ncbi:F/Y rich C-terminus-domain-containing protein [Radiomyces spectabilis]|uniref:F/Y rich C-terminus-domain-containing protein n=1 Tax=Radiomyces spectabilis TaxID=64574 RepID=UPI00221EB84E|nr:F/Y rich C-terminus-domain-containing protein [Radiomyces spectabilis]KAI8372972.1 F/Y rich C-terminus-domain-containing protein [Radiomyces spectabilis]
MTTQNGIDVGCQTEDVWTDDRLRKYRRMKRKILDFITKHKSAQQALDRANRRIQSLHREKSKTQRRSSAKGNDDAMDISQTEDNADDDNGEAEEEVEEDDEEDEEDQIEDDEEVEAVVTKKRTSSRRKKIEIPRDENGTVKLPFSIASLTIINLGTVVWDRSGFHSERYIWPVNYCVERTYMSMVDPTSQTTYVCKVEDGNEGPLFTIRAADAPEETLSAKTATGVWALVIKRANEVRQKESSNAISGPEYYGFAHPIVAELIEELDGVDKCTRYVRRTEA